MRRARRCRCATAWVRRGCGCAAGRCSSSWPSRFGEAAAAKVLAGEVRLRRRYGRRRRRRCCRRTRTSTSTAICPTRSPVPFDIPVLYRDDDIVVVDKPHFLATMPRGGHVAQTALVRLRRELDLPELSPGAPAGPADGGRAAVHGAARGARRATRRCSRAARCARRTWRGRPSTRLWTFPTVVRSRIVKRARAVTGVRGAGRAERRDAGRASRRRPVPADAAHRPHPSAAGAHGVAGACRSLSDPLYPDVIDVARRRLLAPLRLLAHSARVRRSDQRGSSRIVRANADFERTAHNQANHRDVRLGRPLEMTDRAS